MVGSLPSLIRQRREVLPNPGCLDKIIADDKPSNLKTMKRVKKRSKNRVNQDMEADCDKTTVPLITLEERPSRLPDMGIIEPIA